MQFNDIASYYWDDLTEYSKDKITKTLLNATAEHQHLKYNYYGQDLERILEEGLKLYKYEINEGIYYEVLEYDDLDSDEDLTVDMYVKILQGRLQHCTRWYTADEFYEDFLVYQGVLQSDWQDAINGKRDVYLFFR